MGRWVIVDDWCGYPVSFGLSFGIFWCLFKIFGQINVAPRSHQIPSDPVASLISVGQLQQIFSPFALRAAVIHKGDSTSAQPLALTREYIVYIYIIYTVILYDYIILYSFIYIYIYINTRIHIIYTVYIYIYIYTTASMPSAICNDQTVEENWSVQSPRNDPTIKASPGCFGEQRCTCRMASWGLAVSVPLLSDGSFVPLRTLCYWDPTTPSVLKIFASLVVLKLSWVWLFFGRKTAAWFSLGL